MSELFGRLPKGGRSKPSLDEDMVRDHSAPESQAYNGVLTRIPSAKPTLIDIGTDAMCPEDIKPRLEQFGFRDRSSFVHGMYMYINDVHMSIVYS
ncbi:MAG: hypothetical protein ABSD47_01430 [Candidatus Methylomirabilota bacterium]|jgi:hypothetical protein